MPYSIQLLTFDEEIEVAEDETILEIALEENIAYPFGCASGNCGACKSRLVSGDVHMRDYSPFALTDDERARGLVLACRAEPRSDCELAVLNYDDAVAHPLKRVVGEVTSVEKPTHDIAIVRIELSEPVAYTAGQFASVVFPGFPARDYSFATPPYEGQTEVEFHVRRMNDEGVSAFVFDRLEPGEAVAIQGPLGFAFLRERETGPIFAVAGGTGLAPVRAILKSALANPEARGRPIRLWFGVRRERDIYLEQELQALASEHPGFRFKIVLSDKEEYTARRSGLITEVLTTDLAALGEEALDGARAYLAGRPEMVAATEKVFRRAGLARARVHADAFVTEADKAGR